MTWTKAASVLSGGGGVLAGIVTALSPADLPELLHVSRAVRLAVEAMCTPAFARRHLLQWLAMLLPRHLRNPDSAITVAAAAVAAADVDYDSSQTYTAGGHGRAAPLWPIVRQAWKEAIIDLLPETAQNSLDEPPDVPFGYHVNFSAAIGMLGDIDLFEDVKKIRGSRRAPALDINNVCVFAGITSANTLLNHLFGSDFQAVQKVLDDLMCISVFTKDEKLFSRTSESGAEFTSRDAVIKSSTYFGYFTDSELNDYRLEVGKQALCIKASSAGNLAALRLLVPQAVDLADYLQVAVISNHPAIVSFLIERGANVLYNRRLIHIASTNGSISIAKILLDHGVELEEENSHGEKPLRLATEFGHLDMMTLLLDAGADANGANGRLERPLHAATSVEAVRLLLAHGASPDARDCRGRTPLRNAADFQRGLEVITALVDAGADLESRADDERSPLQVMASSDDAKLLGFLVDRLRKRGDDSFDQGYD
ncbi:hypothetical protein HK405_003118 [Cladochytrium tenue]|nr:hypothetical protein HK405_003118 [Cladochytrium tenue]